MQDFKESPKTISLFSSGCMAETGQFMPDISPVEANYVTKSCNNPHDFNLITCQSQNLPSFINEVGGLQLDLSLNPPVIEELPLYIPSLSVESASMLAKSEQHPIIGVTLKDIVKSLTRFGSGGGLREARQISFRPNQEFTAFSKKPKLILFLTGTDTGIEYLWRERINCDLFRILRDMNFIAVSGFNFSLFEGECAIGQALNQKRSLYSSYLLEQNGIQTIPHVYAITSYQVKRWAKWFLLNPGVKYFTINCQLEKPDYYINENIKIVRYFLENIPHLQVILQGFPFDSIYKFGPLLNRIHFVDASPINQARNHARIDIGLKQTKVITKDQSPFLPLLSHNILNREMQLEKIRKNILENPFKKTG